MIQVRWGSCQASFELGERRIPKAGMRVRCPRCAASFHVAPDGTATAAAAPAPPRAGGARDLSFEDLPTAASSAPKGLTDLPTPAVPGAKGLTDLPTVAA